VYPNREERSHNNQVARNDRESETNRYLWYQTKVQDTVVDEGGVVVVLLGGKRSSASSPADGVHIAWSSP
jgi:hypothetical protein